MICQKKIVHLVIFFISSSLVSIWFVKTAIGTSLSHYDARKCTDKERHVLLHFKSCIRHDPYDSLSTWTDKEEGSANDCCEWWGVTCNNESHVTGLDFTNGDLEGAIPPELGNLTNLQVLSLDFVTGYTIGNLDWLSRLSRLEDLEMHRISIAKADNWVNVIINLQKLSSLSLWECDLLHVKHPYSYSPNKTRTIEMLFLEYNNLNSSMYHWLLPLTSNKLECLDLSGNKLDWIPKYIGNLTSLKTLFFEGNLMPLNFPGFLKNLSGCTSVTLRVLLASSSHFIGSLPDDIQNFQSLRDLYLSDNHLNGTLNEKAWELPNLYVLGISSNNLKGDISKSKTIGKLKTFMSYLSNITHINLSSNNFYGSIPNVSSNVRWLQLSGNKFNGGILFLCQISYGSLRLLDLSNNSLRGPIPDCLWQFKNLVVLNLGENNFSGRLPASVGYLINLEALYLYNNNFFGELPLSLKKCTNLTFLDLGSNKFYGYVPIWTGENLSRLYLLRLTSNNFTGTIPLQLCQLVNLKILDLSLNNLYGTIPSCLNNLTFMVHGGLSSNQNVRYHDGYLLGSTYVDYAIIRWEGGAREFQNTLEFVKIIDLSSNNLTGHIPYELTDLHELIALNLSTNALQGEIPPLVGLMKNLLHLDLSRNNLSGLIPTSMSLMTSLDYLNLSSNRLSGRIPSSTQLQSFEPSTYIGNDELCGPPLTKYCPGDKELEVPHVIDQREGGTEDIDELERWFCIGGFSTGFCIACGVLLFNRRGRSAFFSHNFGSLRDCVYVKVMVFISKWKRAPHV